MTIQEIEARKAAISEEMEKEDANLDALTEEVRTLNAEAEKIKAEAEKREALRKEVANGAGKIVEERKETPTMEKVFNVESAEYRSAFLKDLMGKPLTAEERTGMDSQTTSGGYAIPTVTRNLIVENLVQVAPMLNEIDVMHIASNITIPVEGTCNDAEIHTENASISGADDTLVKISLGGYEICKVIPISAKLATTSIDAFEAWLASNLARSLGKLIENYIINGTGSSQPKGIEKAETWVSGTNGVDWASTAPTVAEIEQVIGLQNAAYVRNAKFLMNWTTFWNKIHVLRDDKKEPVVVRENGQYFIFGFPVIFSSKVADNTFYFGDFFEGVKANFQNDVAIENDKSSGFRYNSVDYRGSCIFDCSTVSGRIIKSAASF